MPAMPVPDGWRQEHFGPDMNQFSMTQRKSPPPRPSLKSRPTDSAFDVWLNRGLHQLFDDVANEPVPDELLKLIEDNKDK